MNNFNIEQDKGNQYFYSNTKFEYVHKQNVELLFMSVKDYKIFTNAQNFNLNSKYKILFDIFASW